MGTAKPTFIMKRWYINHMWEDGRIESFHPAKKGILNVHLPQLKKG
jgi:hypothetical protein